MTIKKLTKMFCVLLSIFFLFGMFACKKNVSEFPTFESKEFRFGAFSSPPPTAEAYREYAETGMNYVLLGQNHGGIGSPIYDSILDYCGENNLNAVLMQLIEKDFEVNAERDAALCAKKAYVGKNFKDEPSYSEFERLAGYIKDFERDNPGKLYVNNIYPYIASESSLGGTYENYVKGYIDTVLNKVSGKKILMCDIYPLKSNARGNYLIPGYLYNLETTAHYTMNTDIEVDYYYLTHGHMSYRDISSVKDILFQFNTLMSYGVKGFWAFTYRNQPGVDFQSGHALVKVENKNGVWTTTKNDTYYYVKDAISQLKTMQDAYLHFDYKGTKAILGKLNDDGYNDCFDLLNYNLSELNSIKSVDCTQDTIIGQFEKDGVDAYMVSNFTEPTQDKSDKVNIYFKGKTKARIYRNGNVEEMDILQDKLSIILNSGEAAFIIAI